MAIKPKSRPRGRPKSGRGRVVNVSLDAEISRHINELRQSEPAIESDAAAIRFALRRLFGLHGAAQK